MCVHPSQSDWDACLSLQQNLCSSEHEAVFILKLPGSNVCGSPSQVVGNESLRTDPSSHHPRFGPSGRTPLPCPEPTAGSRRDAGHPAQRDRTPPPQRGQTQCRQPGRRLGVRPLAADSGRCGPRQAAPGRRLRTRVTQHAGKSWGGSGGLREAAAALTSPPRPEPGHLSADMARGRRPPPPARPPSLPPGLGAAARRDDVTAEGEGSYRARPAPRPGEAGHRWLPDCSRSERQPLHRVVSGVESRNVRLRGVKPVSCAAARGKGSPGTGTAAEETHTNQAKGLGRAALLGCAVIFIHREKGQKSLRTGTHSRQISRKSKDHHWGIERQQLRCWH